MTFANGLWKLERTKEDFTPLDFSQRFSGRFSEDGRTIVGTWEIANDHATYEKDFDITYRKVA